MTGKVEPDTTRITRDDRREFEQLIAQGRDLRIGQRCTFERQHSPSLDQGVGQCRQQEAELVGIEVLATGAGGKQTQLRLLDAVLGFTTLAVEDTVSLDRIALSQFDVGHHKARVVALLIKL